MTKHKSSPHSAMHIFWVFMMYTLVFFCIALLISALTLPMFHLFTVGGLLLGCAIIAAVAAYFHIRSGKESQIDHMAGRHH